MKSQKETEGDLQQAGWKQRTLGGFIQAAGPFGPTGTETAGNTASSRAQAMPIGPAWSMAACCNPDGPRTQRDRLGGSRPASLRNGSTRHPFLCPVVPGAFLKATGNVVRATRSLVFMQGVLSVNDDVVLTGSAVLKVMTKEEAPSTQR